MAAITYDTLYVLTEELQKLLGARLKAVLAAGPRVNVLEFFSESQTYLLAFDLSPGDPRLYCVPLNTHLKLTKNSTPIGNFLKAHALQDFLQTFSIAQKPDRTVRLVFKSGTVLIFRCYPQRAQLDVRAEGKRVFQPFYPGFKEEELAFVDPETAEGWIENERQSRDLNTQKNGGRKASGSSPKEKLEKALEKLLKADQSESKKDLEKILELRDLADQLKATSSSKGAKLSSLYDQIKKIEKKGSVRQERIEELRKKIEKASSSSPLVSIVETKPKKKTPPFSGLRILLPSGTEYWVGRNASQNEELLKAAQSYQIWIHLRDYPGAHGLIRHQQKQNISAIDLDFACNVVAILSRNPKKQFQAGDVLDFFTVQRKFLRKPKGSPPGHVLVDREVVRRVAFNPVRFDILST